MLINILCSSNEMVKHQVTIECEKFPIGAPDNFFSELRERISILLGMGTIIAIIAVFVFLFRLLSSTSNNGNTDNKIANVIYYLLPLIVDLFVAWPLLKNYFSTFFQISDYHSEPEREMFLILRTMKNGQRKLTGSDIITVRKIFDPSKDNIEDINVTSSPIYDVVCDKDGKVMDVEYRKGQKEVLEIEFMGKNTDRIANTIANWKALHQGGPAHIIFNFLAGLIICGILIISHALLEHKGPASIQNFDLPIIVSLLISCTIPPLLLMWIKRNLYYHVELAKLEALILSAHATQKAHVRYQIGLKVDVMDLS